MQNILRIDASVLKEVLKKTSIAKGKESGYTLAISTKVVEGKYHQCSILCGNGNMQATSGFYAQLARTDTVEGKEVVLKEPLGTPLFLRMSSVFREVVEALAEMEDKLLLINEGNTITAKNTKSSVPIPLMETSLQMENPKGHKNITVTIEKESFEAALEFVNATLSRSSNSRFGPHYGLLPLVDGERGLLHIFSSDEKSASYQEVELSGMSENYVKQCENLNYAMVPADKVSQIIANSGDKLKFTFYYNEDGVSAKQVNIRSGNDMYQMLTHITSRYPQQAKAMVDRAYTEYEATFQTDVKSLRNALQITALGSNPDKVKSIMTITQSGITISDESGQQLTDMKGSETSIDDGRECVRINVAYDLMMSALRPFEGKIKVQGSNEDTMGLITLVGGMKGVHIVVYPIKGKKTGEKIEEDVDDNEGEEEEMEE